MSINILNKVIFKIGNLTNFKYASKSNKQMERIIDNSDIISFDMFDTLVERLVYKPTDVFDIIEKKFDSHYHKKSNFKELRIKSEMSVSRANNSITTLEEIYDNLENFDVNEKTYLKKLELDIEKDLIKIKHEGKRLYDYAKTHNKKCILTSDMYLPKQFIINILNDSGYNFDEYYISGDIKTSKCNSKMFEVLKNKYSNKKIVHIGDNYYHDILNAKKYKIKTIYLANNKKVPSRYTLDESLISSFKNYKKFNTNLEEFGYKLFGPFMLGFSNFINRNSNGDILFLSRDGYFMKKVYDLIFPNNNSKYFYASRKAFIIPKFHVDSSFNNVKNSFAWNYYLSWSDFLKALNVSVDFENVDVDKIYTKDHFFNVENENIYNKYIKDILKENADVQYALIKEYFKNNVTRKDITVIDIGWQGNMQKAIECIFLDYNILGLYTGILCNKSNYKGYMFDIKESLELLKKEASFNPMFESLFFAPHGSTVCYQKSNNEIKPVLEELTDTYKNSYELINIIQEKCLEFIKDISKYFDVFDYNIDLVNPLIDFLYNPSKDFLKELSSLYLDNYNEFPLYRKYKGNLIHKYLKIRKINECRNYSLKMSTNKLEFFLILKLKKLKSKIKVFKHNHERKIS